MTVDFEEWLNTPGASRCVLVELDHIDGDVMKTACFANAAFATTPTDTPPNTPYDPFVVGSFSYERSLNEVFTGRSVSKTSDIELVYQPQSEALLTKGVYGQAIRIYMGDKRWPKADFRQIIAGICDNVTPEQSTIRIKFRDAADALKKPLLTERYATGPAAGQLKPLTLGRCFNIKPLLIDEAAHVYQFSIGQSSAVTAVRFNGALVAPAHYTVNLLNSTVTFSTHPMGDVTMDVDGQQSGDAWLQTATQFIQHIASIGGVSVDVSGLPDYQLGLYITAETDAADIIDDICASVGGYWFYSRFGQFTVRAFNGLAAATVDITRDQTVANTMRPRRVIAPLKSITMQYKRNWTVQSNVAASVYELTPALADELSKEGKTKPCTQALPNFPQAESISPKTLIVNEADATTEGNRRLAIAVKPRFIYELQAFSAPFSWPIGATATLERPGINGDRAVITKLVESPVSGTCNVEIWQ